MNISKKEKELLNDIKNTKSIIVVPADKGGKVVVMDKEIYIQQIEEKLKDTELYQIVKDPTEKIKKEISLLTNKLFKENKITENQKYQFLSIDNLVTVKGQPKIHKKDNPIRIITYAHDQQTHLIYQNLPFPRLNNYEKQSTTV